MEKNQILNNLEETSASSNIYKSCDFKNITSEHQHIYKVLFSAAAYAP